MNIITERSIHRILLDNLIRCYADLAVGRVLDIGSKNRRYDACLKNASSIVAIDIYPERNDVIKADGRFLPFKNSSFDAIVSFEVLEYIPETAVVINEVFRVLKPGGKLLFSIPFHNPVHGEAVNDVNMQFSSKGTDFVRYTAKGLHHLLNGKLEILEIISIGGRWGIISDFAFERFRKIKYLRILIAPIYFLSYLTSSLFDRIEKNRRFVMGYFVICKKR